MGCLRVGIWMESHCFLAIITTRIESAQVTFNCGHEDLNLHIAIQLH